MFDVSQTMEPFEAAAELLKVLSAPARLAIVVALAHRPRFVHELVDELGLSQPLVSAHLRVLRAARVVSVERQGRQAAYSLADDHVAHIVADAIGHSAEVPSATSTAGAAVREAGSDRPGGRGRSRDRRLRAAPGTDGGLRVRP